MNNHGCYIYTRVSTAMQVDGFSLDAQKEKLRKYAEFQNYYIFGEYSDEGKSGKNISGRPEFQRMMEDIATGKDNVEYVLVFKLSRFGRNAADVLSCLQEMQDYGVNLICVEDGIDSSKDSGKLMISVLSAVAEIERENILVQTMEGRKQKAREGKWNGGFAPYGYKLVDGKLEIAEEEAEVIKLIYDKFVHTNMGAATIARYLNDHGYKKIQRQNGTLDTFSAHFIKIVLDNPVYCGKLAYGRRKNEKINGTRNQYHTVKQDDFPIYDGIHEAIVSEKVWTQAQAKRRQTGVKNEKIYSLEHQHLLSGLVCCPECGKPMYGSVNRKKKKDGSFYSDYWYYACKHRLGYDGHKCNYTHQIHQEELNAAVEEIVKQMVKNPAFEAAIQEKLNASMDTEALEKEIELLRKRLRQMTAAKDKVADQMDTLDIADENYEMRYDDLQARQDNIYNEIGATRKELQELEIRIHNIREQKITSERVYEFLQMYDIVYDKFSDAEKKEFMNSFIEKVEVYPERQPDGRILKSIQFRFPIYFHEDKIDMFFPDEKKTVETVCLLVLRNPVTHINIDVDYVFSYKTMIDHCFGGQEMNHYKSWSGLNKQLSDCLCDALKDRVSYFLTRYHQVHNSYGRASIRLDGKELAVFTWFDGYKQENDTHKRWKETGIWDSEAPELREKWEEEGTLSEWDFLQAATDFLQMPIADALISDNCLIRIFAILDRRVGKRTIQQIQGSEIYKTYPEWVQRFYELRFACR